MFLSIFFRVGGMSGSVSTVIDTLIQDTSAKREARPKCSRIQMSNFLDRHDTRHWNWRNRRVNFGPSGRILSTKPDGHHFQRNEIEMSSDDDVTSVSETFANCVLAAKWAEILPLLSESLARRVTAETLASEFGWDTLSVRLREMFMEMSGEPEDMVPELDPPVRFEVYEDAEWDAPEGLEPELGWVEVDFLPDEESGFDTCYNCFLGFADENGPRIMAFEISLPD